MDGQDPRYKQYNGRGVPIDIFTGSNGLILTYRVSLNANNSVKETLETKLKNWGVLVNLKYWLGIIFKNIQRLLGPCV